MRRAGACSMDRQRRNVDGALVGNPKRIRPGKTHFVTQQLDTETLAGTRQHGTEIPAGTQQHGTETPAGTQQLDTKIYFQDIQRLRPNLNTSDPFSRCPTFSDTISLYTAGPNHHGRGFCQVFKQPRPVSVSYFPPGCQAVLAAAIFWAYNSMQGY